MFNQQANESTKGLFFDFVLFAVLFMYFSYRLYQTFSVPFQLSIMFVILAVGVVGSLWRAVHYFRKVVCKFIPCSV